ncbi:hypothetical protein ROLI_027920 [Roseobacter fucihabitans]|uniref:Dihydrodipicolinate reductase n=1 Tax=Roseobacter fucihabitans TaxID=1537242 RepID=A0ABZ2BUV1_9RHOB|nr:hypothetical protein [Roseobacter litoralis]MBC6967074.1 hypothetical protein [Roseobacter litoralis]
MRTSIFAISVVVLVTTSALPALAGNFKRIKSAEEFTALVVGKKIEWDGGTAMIHANGKTDGKLKKQGKYAGNWVFSKGFYCRNLVINKKETGTNCQTVEIDGNSMRLTRDQGKGQSTVLSLK